MRMSLKANPEYNVFNDAMTRILRADPKAVKDAMEQAKKANAEARKAKKMPSASGRVSDGKD